MYSAVAVVLAVLFVWILIHAHHVRERKKDLSMMKRHAATYGETNGTRLAG